MWTTPGHRSLAPHRARCGTIVNPCVLFLAQSSSPKLLVLSTMNSHAIIAAANAAITAGKADENKNKCKGADGTSPPLQEIPPADLLTALIKDHLFFKQEAL